MRLLVLNWRDWRDPLAGGAEVHLRELLTRCVQAGDEVSLVVSRPHGAPAAEVFDGVRVVRAGTDLTAAWAVPAAARRLLDTERFDVLVDDVNKIPFRAPRWSTIPVVALFHHLFGCQFFRTVDPARATALWLLERRIGRVYRGTPAIAVSASTKAELVQLGLQPDDVTVVENGLDHAIYRPGAPAAPRAPFVAVVSRLVNYKRVDVAIRAAALLRQTHPDLRWRIAGDGPARAGLEALARRLAAPVEFLGAVSVAAKVALLQQAAVFVAPSAKEGFGLAVVEAAACGAPVVLSDVPGHRDALPTESARRFPAGDAVACATSIARVLADPIATRAMVAAAQVRVANLHWDLTAAAIRRRFHAATFSTSLATSLRATAFQIPSIRSSS